MGGRTFGMVALLLSGGCGGKVSLDSGGLADSPALDAGSPTKPTPVRIPLGCGPTTCKSGVCCDSTCGICGSADGSCPPSTCAGSSSTTTPGTTRPGLKTCESARDCAPDFYCDSSMNRECGTGVCVQRPPICGENVLPTCGCDGKTYDNPCLANLGGTSVDSLAQCGKGFACGSQSCDRVTSYCEIDNTQGEDAFYTCVALPLECRSTGGHIPDCSCFPPPPPCTSPACVQKCSATSGDRPAFTITIGN